MPPITIIFVGHPNIYVAGIGNPSHGNILRNTNTRIGKLLQTNHKIEFIGSFNFKIFIKTSAGDYKVLKKWILAAYVGRDFVN